MGNSILKQDFARYKTIMKILTGVISVGLVLSSSVSAATLEQWRKRPPRWEVTTTKPISALIECLGSKWAGSLSLQMQAMPIEKGMAYVNTGPNRDVLVDVTDEGEVRRVRLWLRKYLGITVGAKEQISKLDACAQLP